MAINNPFVETSSNLWYLKLTMIGITVLSDTMIRFSTLKHFWKQFPHGQVKKAVSVHVMTQIDDTFESTDQADHMIW